jgi:hypothetical protein
MPCVGIYALCGYLCPRVQLTAACCSTGDRSSPVISRLTLLPRFDGVTKARCLLFGRSGAFMPCGYLCPAGIYALRVFMPCGYLCPAGTGERAMESCQIGSRPGYQGCQTCDKVQWFEDDVGSTGPKAFATAKAFASLMGWAPLMRPAFAVRCFQLVADVAV